MSAFRPNSRASHPRGLNDVIGINRNFDLTSVRSWPRYFRDTSLKVFVELTVRVECYGLLQAEETDRIRTADFGDVLDALSARFSHGFQYFDKIGGLIAARFGFGHDRAR